jgi:uncharacterized protein (DUF433 family)
MTIASINHIVLDEKGIAWIEGTRTKVVEIVLDHTAWGMSPSEIHDNYPPLTLAQIHAALAYYYDHKERFDAEMAEAAKSDEALRAASLDSPARRKLREKGLI